MLVQKFGGSSVGSPEKIRKIAARIAKTRREGQQVVVVVSAMGDTTDDFIELARQVTDRPPHLHEREMDVLLSAGERISMALLSMALRDQNVEAISFTGSQAGIITDESHTRARILEIKPFRVREELAKNKVVIVAGFQGVSREKEITTLGRGGSDTTAVAMAAALGADRCEIFTDVPGMFSADPRIVPGARHYPELPLDLVLEMTVKGAQVMHPRSIEIAREKQFPIFVGLAHPKGPSEEGTMLIPEINKSLELPKIIAVTSRTALKAVHLTAAEANAALDELGRDSRLIHDLSLTAEHGAFVLLDPTESAGFLARHSKNVLPETLATVSVVGYQIQQSARIPAKILNVLNGNGIKPVGLTSHPQSITVWVSDSDSKNAVRLLHDALVGKGE